VLEVRGRRRRLTGWYCEKQKTRARTVTDFELFDPSRALDKSSDLERVGVSTVVSGSCQSPRAPSEKDRRANGYDTIGNDGWGATALATARTSVHGNFHCSLAPPDCVNKRACVSLREPPQKDHVGERPRAGPERRGSMNLR
jgi:hypothetical protein